MSISKSITMGKLNLVPVRAFAVLLKEIKP